MAWKIRKFGAGGRSDPPVSVKILGHRLFLSGEPCVAASSPEDLGMGSVAMVVPCVSASRIHHPQDSTSLRLAAATHMICQDTFTDTPAVVTLAAVDFRPVIRPHRSPHPQQDKQAAGA